MPDQVLTVITQIEIDLQTLVAPSPLPPPTIPSSNQHPEYDNWIAMTSAFKTGVGTELGPLTAIRSLLQVLYQIKFIGDVGSTTLPPLIKDVRDVLRQIADKLGNVSAVASPSAIEGLKTFLSAIQKLPGSPPALADAGDILAQITGLLDDIPSAQNELYMIVQQLTVFADVFSHP